MDDFLKLYNPEDLCIQTFTDSAEKRMLIRNDKDPLAATFPYNHPGSKMRIEELQAREAGVFFATNPQGENLQRGVKLTTEFRYLSLDLDVAKEKSRQDSTQIESAKQILLDKLKNLPIPPFGVIITKNGLQPIWKFSDFKDLNTESSRVEGNKLYKQMCQAVSIMVGINSDSDSISRVVRFPGYEHLKTPTDPYKIIYQEISGDECSFEEFNKAYPITESIKQKSTGPFDWTKLVGMTDGAGRNDGLLGAIESALGKRIPKDVVAKIAYGINYGLFKEPLGEEEFKVVVQRAYDHIKENSDKVTWPSPLNEAAYHGIAGEFVRLTLPYSEADPVFLLTGFLTTFGNILDRPYIKVEKTVHKMKLFVVWVGTTSSGRKGTAIDQVRPVVSELDPAWGGHIINGGLATGEGLINAVKDPVTKIKDGQEVTIEEGVKDKRVLVIETEYAQVLRVMGREHNILSPILRNAWDRGDLRTLTKTSPLKATGTHISLICHITPDELKASFRAVDTTNGFGNRFLWFMGKRSKLLPLGGEVPERDSKQLYWNLVKVVAKAQVIDEITFGCEAKELWCKLYTDLNEETSGIVGAMSARVPPYILRMAAIYTLSDGLSVIGIEHLRAAVAVVDYSIASLQYIFREHSTTGDLLADKIVEALKARGSMSRDDILNYFGRNLSSEQISSSLELLLKIGRINQSTIPTSGRYKDHFSLNSLPRTDIQKKSYLERLDQYIEELGFKNHSGADGERKELRDNEKNEVSQKETELKRDEIKINSLPGLEGYGH